MDFKSYKGEIGRLEFFKVLIGCCFINWLLSVVVTILTSAVSPFFSVLYLLSLYVWMILLFNYKKRGLNIFKNEIVSWTLALIVVLFGFIFALWQIVTATAFNLLEQNIIKELPFFTGEMFGLWFSFVGLIPLVVLLVYLFVPGEKVENRK